MSMQTPAFAGHPERIEGAQELEGAARNPGLLAVDFDQGLLGDLGAGLRPLYRGDTHAAGQDQGLRSFPGGSEAASDDLEVEAAAGRTQEARWMIREARSRSREASDPKA